MNRSLSKYASTDITQFQRFIDFLNADLSEYHAEDQAAQARWRVLLCDQIGQAVSQWSANLDRELPLSNGWIDRLPRTRAAATRRPGTLPSVSSVPESQRLAYADGKKSAPTYAPSEDSKPHLLTAASRGRAWALLENSTEDLQTTTLACCPWCARFFFVEHERSVYCSPACKRVANRPSKEHLAEYMRNYRQHPLVKNPSRKSRKTSTSAK